MTEEQRKQLEMMADHRSEGATLWTTDCDCIKAALARIAELEKRVEIAREGLAAIQAELKDRMAQLKLQDHTP